MRTSTSLILTSLLFFYASASHCDNSFYIGLGAGGAVYDYEHVDPTNTAKFFIGYKITRHFAIEAAMLGTGDADITSIPIDNFIMITEGSNISALYLVPNEENRITAIYGVGIYNLATSQKISGTIVYPGKERSSGLSLTAGIEYAATEHFSLRADVNIFTDIDNLNQDGNLTTVQASAVFRF